MTTFEYSIRSEQLASGEVAEKFEQRDIELEDYLTRRFGTGEWTSPMRMAGYSLWVDASGDLRIVQGNPSSDLDGTVVGTQA